MENLQDIKKELQKVKNELRNKDEVINELKHNMNRISFMLNEWVEKYDFLNKPDPRAALEYAKNMATSTDLHGKQSLMWFWEYNRIFTLVDVALEYAINADKIMVHEG